MTAGVTDERVRVATIGAGVASVTEFTEAGEDRLVDVVERLADVPTVPGVIPGEGLREFGVYVPGPTRAVARLMMSMMRSASARRPESGP